MQKVLRTEFSAIIRAILATASEDNTVRLWGHHNKLKRENGKTVFIPQCVEKIMESM